MAEPRLALRLSIEPSEVLPGESIQAAIDVTNRGAGATQVHDPKAPSELQFVVKAADGSTAAVWSQRRARAAATGDSAPKLPVRLVSLAPGDSLQYRGDLADYATEPLAPGRYQVVAGYEIAGEYAESAPAALTIETPRLSALAAAASPSGGMGAAFQHRAGSGGGVVYHQESQPGPPARTSLVRRGALPEPGAAIAVTTPLTNDPGGRGVRFAAWLEGATLRGVVGQGRATFGKLSEALLELREPRLAPTGWQRTNRHGLFLVTGAGRVALVGLDAFAPAVVATADVDVPAGALLAAQYAPEEPGAKLHLVWSTLDSVRLQRRTLSLRMGAPGPNPWALEVSADAHAAEIASRDGRLLAIGLAPVGGIGAASVDLVVAPSAGARTLAIARVPLAGGAPLAEWSVPNLTADEAGAAPDAFALAPLADPVLVARAGGRLFARRAASGSGWKEVAADVQAEPAPRAVAARDEALAVWVDPRLGVQSRPLP
jgi:hypothetical protein